MSAITNVRFRENNKPGRRVIHITGTWPTTDTTATLKVAAGNLIMARGVSVGTAAPGTASCTDAQSAGVVVPTLSGGTNYINMARSEAGSGAAYFFEVEYDSQ